MGDLEFHYQKVEEAKQQGIEEGMKKQAEANNNGVFGVWVFVVICILSISVLGSHGSENGNTTNSGDETAVSQTVSLPSDIGDYIANDNTRFYKYTGSDGVTYVRHHYEPNDQLSKQGYYRADTGEYILLTMDFYPKNGECICNWRIVHAVNGQKQTVSNGADAVYAAGISSENCVNALVQALTDYGYDSSVSTGDGTEITPSEGRNIIGF